MREKERAYVIYRNIFKLRKTHTHIYMYVSMYVYTIYIFGVRREVSYIMQK